MVGSDSEGQEDDGMFVCWASGASCLHPSASICLDGSKMIKIKPGGRREHQIQEMKDK